MADLLIGCGSRRNKDIRPNGDKDFHGLITLDHSPEHHPNVVYDLTVHPLPFDSDSFDEIHAYEVLEHLATQGDYRFFFSEFSEYWRILKPNGFFCASVPMHNSPWVWGDPSHKRVINSQTLTFLSQANYDNQVGVTKMSDFRDIYKADFKRMWQEERSDGFYFVLQAIKTRA